MFNMHLGSSGLEPPTSRLSGARSNQLSYEPAGRPASKLGFLSAALESDLTTMWSSLGFYPTGDDGIRTHDPLLAGQVLSQLSYTPMWFSWLCLLLYNELFLSFTEN